MQILTVSGVTIEVDTKRKEMTLSRGAVGPHDNGRRHARIVQLGDENVAHAIAAAVTWVGEPL